ncbi:hypothetical protein C8J57DRAFT_1720207 [Mycena rebaudengoi]|nr:hypothetical protein C8J57DRAFT_1720207 [Mycena rebaudengoi]
MAPSRTSPKISATRRQACGRRASEALAGKHARAVTSAQHARPPRRHLRPKLFIFMHADTLIARPLLLTASAFLVLPPPLSHLYSSYAPCALCSPPRSFMFASPSRCSLSVIHLLDLIRPPPRLPMESYLFSLLSGRCDYCSPSHTPFSQSYSYAPPLSPQFMHASPFNIYTSNHTRFPFLRSLLHRSTAVSIKYSSTLQGRGSRP